MNDIVIIAPYKDLFSLCNRIIKERGYKDIDVILGDLSQGVVEAKKAVAKGAKIIISRGGTYRMIKNSVNIPVVELRITAFDLLKGFKEVMDYKGKIGVVGFENVIYGCKKIGEVLDLDIVKIGSLSIFGVGFLSIPLHYYFYPYFCVMIEMDRITCILGTLK